MSELRTKGRTGKQRRPRQNRGFVLIAVLVCLSVIAAIMFSAMMTSLRHRRQLDRELQMEQTRWLTDAGIGRALAAVGNIELDDASVFEKRFQIDLPRYADAEVIVNITPDQQRGVAVVEVVSSIGTPDRPELMTRHRVRKEFSLDTKEKNDENEK